MNSTEKNIDRLIREALSEEESRAFDDLGEQSLVEMMFGIFRGRLRFLSIGWAIITLIFFVFAIYAAVEFLDTDVPGEQILWGAIFFFMLGSIMSMKIWGWMEMQKNQMIREIKRVELQVANLAARMSEKKDSREDSIPAE